MLKKILLTICLSASIIALAQETFTRKDTLFGGLRPERTSFDVMRYDLTVKVLPKEKKMYGLNEITFKVVENTNIIQIDLFENMKIDSIKFKGFKLEYKREFNAVFIDFAETLSMGNTEKIAFYYSGNPIIAKRAPWDGGFVFTKDKNGKDFIGVAVQGTGASLWYPCKDSQTDEPNLGATIKLIIPDGLVGVSNGRFKGSEKLKNGFTRWNWEVKNPINNYDITLYIGDYIHFSDKHGGLDLDYYVLRENEAKARIQFQEVKPMMDFFQAKFGPYPFKEDGYKLVETNYLGMEHQSAVAYGNQYKKGYLGTDLSSTNFGLLFDFIIIHESGHEWFGNSITSKDVADMWIHEGFTCYTEAVYLECKYGATKAKYYINGLAQNIQADKPIIGQYGVANEGSSDMYYKGALMLHTIRNVINNDERWWKMLYDYAQHFKHQIIDTEAVIAFFNQESKLDLTPIFNQYLHYTNLPKLEFKKVQSHLEYRWVTDVDFFDMPIDIMIRGNKIRLCPTKEWQIFEHKINALQEIEVLKQDFFIDIN